MSEYYRPIIVTDVAARSERLAGGWTFFDRVERMTRAGAEIVPLSEVPDDVMERLIKPRVPMAGLSMQSPQVMGILNVTPDSFSDGGSFVQNPEALAHAAQMEADGASIIDIGGESTRPGAAEVPIDQEIDRVVPVISAIRAQSQVAISIDTRKAAVAEAALDAGATIVNDVSAFSWDEALGDVTASRGAPVCLMHAQGDPQTMQENPKYDDVLLDVYDYLAGRIALAESKGIARHQILIDPGIGFGKSLDHNLALLQRVSLFHALGCSILLGVSRKRFIGMISGEEVPDRRVAGSLSLGLWGVSQGVQIVRVHDTYETGQAIKLQQAVLGQ